MIYTLILLGDLKTIQEIKFFEVKEYEQLLSNHCSFCVYNLNFKYEMIQKCTVIFAILGIDSLNNLKLSKTHS